MPILNTSGSTLMHVAMKNHTFS